MKKENTELPNKLKKYRKIISSFDKVIFERHYYIIVLENGFYFNNLFGACDCFRHAMFKTISEARSALSSVKKIA